MSKKDVVDRRQLRGKPLLDMCVIRPDIIVHDEFGENDNRQFCLGLIDKGSCEYLDECKQCGAWVRNSWSVEATE